MKDGGKFIVFMSDESEDQMSADLICVTVDNEGKAHVYRTIKGFYKSLLTLVRNDLRNILPKMDE